jgi:hypothetical protein
MSESMVWVQRFPACWWIHIGKYVVRIGKPWGHNTYRYAWRPLISIFRCYR